MATPEDLARKAAIAEQMAAQQAALAIRRRGGGKSAAPKSKANIVVGIALLLAAIGTFVALFMQR